MVSATAGLVSATRSGLRRVDHHAGQRVGGVAQHALGNAVDARHVGHRIHHHDVGRADIGLHVARGDGRHHDLGHADRQAAHGGGGQRGAARAAGRDQPADVAPFLDEVGEGHRHLRHGRAAVVGEDGALALGMVPRHLARMRPWPTTACPRWRGRPSRCAGRASPGSRAGRAARGPWCRRCRRHRRRAARSSTPGIRAPCPRRPTRTSAAELALKEGSASPLSPRPSISASRGPTAGRSTTGRSTSGAWGSAAFQRVKPRTARASAAAGSPGAGASSPARRMV